MVLDDGSIVFEYSEVASVQSPQWQLRTKSNPPSSWQGSPDGSCDRQRIDWGSARDGSRALNRGFFYLLHGWYSRSQSKLSISKLRLETAQFQGSSAALLSLLICTPIPAKDYW